MEVTEVRVSLRSGVRPSDREGHPSEPRLKAYVTVAFDHCFVVRNIKVIEGRTGLFVAMPSHKAKIVCTRCQFKNDVGGRFCAQCGSRLPAVMEHSGISRGAGETGDCSAHRDIAHPITAEFRNYLQQRVLEVFEAERAKVRQHEDMAASAA